MAGAAIVLVGVLALVLVSATSAQAAAGGGSSGFRGGGGGGRGKGFALFLLLRLVFLVLIRHPIVIAVLAALAVAVGLFRAADRARSNAARGKRERRVELAAAEASESDEAFAPDVVREQGRTLFCAIQAAWDARDRGRLAQLVGEDLLVEWGRRLDDFDARGWHNRVSVLRGPTVQYVGLTNRGSDADDRVVVHVEATLRDGVEDRFGGRITPRGRLTETAQVAEYWTLAKRDGGWVLVSTEQRREGEHHLAGDVVATPWADTERLRDEALVERAAADKLPEGMRTADVVDLDFAGDARAVALDLSLVDGRFAPAVIEVAVRRAVAAWAQAVDGDHGDLRGVATDQAVAELLHPGDGGGQTRLVVRGPRLLAVNVVALDAAADPPTLTVEAHVEGRRYVEDRDTAAVLSGSKSRPVRFTERWTMALERNDEQPWRIVDAAQAGIERGVASRAASTIAPPR